jgi:hypothetical protein
VLTGPFACLDRFLEQLDEGDRCLDGFRLAGKFVAGLLECGLQAVEFGVVRDHCAWSFLLKLPRFVLLASGPFCGARCFSQLSVSEEVAFVKC